MSGNWEFRPARDLGLTRGERLRSLVREAGLGSRITAGLWRSATRWLLTLGYRLTVEGGEHLPAQPPFVLVANHTSHLDALAVAAALPAPLARHAFALAAGDTFFTNDLSATFAAYAINALPIWRKHTSAADLATLRERVVEDRCILILFPEGTRSRTGVLARFRPGIGVLVAGTSIPVVPCHLDGAHAAWPPERRFPGRGRLRLRIGPPLTFAATSADRSGFVEVAAACEDAVRRLDV